MGVAAVIVLVAGLGVGVTLAVLGNRRVRVQRAVERVMLPANLIRRTWTGGWWYLVEYPGPDGTPIRAEVFAVPKRVISARGMRTAAQFTGRVWVAVQDPTDVQLEPYPRTMAGTAALIAGIAVAVVSVTVAASLAAVAAIDVLGT